MACWKSGDLSRSPRTPRTPSTLWNPLGHPKTPSTSGTLQDPRTPWDTKYLLETTSIPWEVVLVKDFSGIISFCFYI